MSVNNKNSNSIPLKQIYEELEKSRITNNEWLSDFSVYKFHEILRKFSNFQPRDTLLFVNHLKNRNAARITAIPQNQNHLQIIHTNNHWICIYFDTKRISEIFL